MRVWVTGFALGVVCLQWQARLPPVSWVMVLALSGVVLARIATFAPRCAVGSGRRVARHVLMCASGGLLGFFWAASMAQWRMSDALTEALEGQDVQVIGVVASLPQRIERGERFEFDVEQAPSGVPSNISLSWYRRLDESREGRGVSGVTAIRDASANADAPAGEESEPMPVRAGERWRFTVRLKRPHGNVNPHGFDYEAWLLERGVRATGYIRSNPSPAQRLESMVWRPAYVIERVRELMRERFRHVLGSDAPYAGVLVALAVGDQRAIDPELWQVFARTGITHLMSISGLHVTMFAAMAYALIAWAWRRSASLPLRLPAQQAATLGGFVAAMIYCLLAGFAAPAQRTLYMLGVVVLARFSGREIAVSRALFAALLLVLLLDPWAVLSAGFWLSFGAVGLLLSAGTGRLRPASGLIEWARAQWVVTIGMLPALLALFQQFSLVSPLANAVAIPVVSLLVTPLTLLGALPPFDPALHLAHGLTRWLMVFVDGLAGLPIAVWQQAAAPFWQVLLALAGGVWLLLPRGFSGRWLGLFAFLPLLTTSPPRPAADEARVTVLDVGQGLAVHVQTANHDLLFDAGPRFSADADSGNRIIAPFLRATGVRRLDTLVVSHADTDHEGGAASVLAAVPVERMKTSLPFEHPLSAQPVPQSPCVAGDRWEWDGVTFEMLHPENGPLSRKTNDASCVLAIAAGGRRMLLTSDIEAVAEQALLRRWPAGLRAEVMTVPHHGSRTSSTMAFIQAVGAREVIFPVGYRNRFGHPKDEVVARYLDNGAALHRTDRDGAVSVLLTARGISIRHAREEDRRYWHAARWKPASDGKAAWSGNASRVD